MDDKQTIFVNCTGCDARYRVVRVEATATDKFREIACVACDAPLKGRDGAWVLKYFLASGRARKRRS
jgi:hypothetical protein